MTNLVYSFVIPVFNEIDTLPELERRLGLVLDGLDAEAEIIMIDDGSKDGSGPYLDAMADRDPRCKVIHLSRNFGHQIAITAGIDVASGNAVIIMDADLQDPPEVVHEMIVRWREGYEIVYGVRKSREGDSIFKRATAATYYRLLRTLANIDIPADTGDFRLVDRKAIEAFKLLREKSRFVRGIFNWIGFRHIAIEYHREARFAGDTKYPARKMLKLALDGIFSFSNRPLRIILRLGIWVACLSFAAGFAALYLKLSGAYTVRGWTSMLLVTSFMSGVQLIVLGIIGEYVGRIADEVRGRPLYFIRDSRGFIKPPLVKGGFFPQD